MTDVNVRALVTHALESDNRIDAAEAKEIIDTILEGGVTKAEYQEARALFESATGDLKTSAWVSGMLIDGSQAFRAQGNDAMADAHWNKATEVVLEAQEFGTFTKELVTKLGAERGTLRNLGALIKANIGSLLGR